MSTTNSLSFERSLVKKYWMALTGLFLCLFLVGHLAGNLQLLMDNTNDAARLAFNEYAKFMTSNPVVKILSYVTYLSILFHAIDGVILTMKNKKARPVNYAYSDANASSTWASRSMALLGSVIFIFIVLHMNAFWAKMHFSELALDSNGNKDLYAITVDAFKSLPVVIFYVTAMIMLAFHLSHGFQSAFQSLGLNHKKYTPAIKRFGTLFSFGISLLFAIIPVYLFLTA